jgi:hypothetical protein
MVALGMGEPKEGGQERGRGREAICAEHARDACFGVKKERRLVSLAAPALPSTRGGLSTVTWGPPLLFGLCASPHICLCAPC